MGYPVHPAFKTFKPPLKQALKPIIYLTKEELQRVRDLDLSMGISPNIVMKWTGHSDYKAMKPYIDIVDSIKAESMTKFNNLL